MYTSSYFELYLVKVSGVYVRGTPPAERIKGIVQRDVRGVKSRLKRSILIKCLVTFVHFLKLNGHPCERGKKPVQHLNNY